MIFFFLKTTDHLVPIHCQLKSFLIKTPSDIVTVKRTISQLAIQVGVMGKSSGGKCGLNEWFGKKED